MSEKDTYVWRLTIPSDGGPPNLDAGSQLADVEPNVFMAIVGESMVNIGTELLTTVITQSFHERDVLTQEKENIPDFDESDDVVYE